MDDLAVNTYIAYLILSIALTIWVARTLFKSGRTFLVDAVGGREDLADSINHLLVVGFYLVNLGYVLLALRISSAVMNLRHVFEALATKLGFVLLVLGVMHFGNLYVLNRLRKRAVPSFAGRVPAPGTEP